MRISKQRADKGACGLEAVMSANQTGMDLSNLIPSETISGTKEISNFPVEARSMKSIGGVTGMDNECDLFPVRCSLCLGPVSCPLFDRACSHLCCEVCVWARLRAEGCEQGVGCPCAQGSGHVKLCLPGLNSDDGGSSTREEALRRKADSKQR